MKRLFLPLLIAVSFAMSGCSLFEAVGKGAFVATKAVGGALAVSVDDAINITVLKIIVEQPDKEAAAREIISVANDFKARADAGALMTVDDARAHLMMLVAMSNYDLAEQYAANRLVSNLSEQLEARVNAGAVASDIAIEIHKLADAVITAAKPAL